jgi:hypothetical protein
LVLEEEVPQRNAQNLRPPGIDTDMLPELATNVSLGTADLLSYAMVVVVSVFLVSGPLITYYFWKKNKKLKMAQPAPAPV